MIKKIIIGLILCSNLLCFIGCTRQNESEKVSEKNLNGKFYQNQMIDLLEIQNFSISSFDNTSYISFDVMNRGESTYVNSIRVLGYDIDNNLIMEVYGYVGKNLGKDSSKHIEIETDINLSNIYSMLYERV